MKGPINGTPELDWLITKLNTNFTVQEYGVAFGESRTAIWRALLDGHLEGFNRGKRKFINGYSAAKRNNLTHLLRQVSA
jgi:hypothetical protein